MFAPCLEMLTQPPFMLHPPDDFVSAPVVPSIATCMIIFLHSLLFPLNQPPPHPTPPHPTPPCMLMHGHHVAEFNSDPAQPLHVTQPLLAIMGLMHAMLVNWSDLLILPLRVNASFQPLCETER